VSPPEPPPLPPIQQAILAYLGVADQWAIPRSDKPNLDGAKALAQAGLVRVLADTGPALLIGLATDFVVAFPKTGQSYLILIDGAEEGTLLEDKRPHQQDHTTAAWRNRQGQLDEACRKDFPSVVEAQTWVLQHAAQVQAGVPAAEIDALDAP
jgi:hypothetical protein